MLEIVDDYGTDTYRVVYTVKFADVVFVLHAFQKKSKRGIATPKADLDLIRKRFEDAEQLYKNPPPKLRAAIEAYREERRAYELTKRTNRQ